MNKPKISYSEFVTKYNGEILRNKKSFIRKGQALMIYLADVWYDEYIRLSSLSYYGETDIDCFYKDELIDNTLKHLKKVWV